MYGELIRAARKRKGWTQSDLAYKLGINQVGIVQWEQNRRTPKLETRQKIARALDIDITELMLQPEREEYKEKYGSCEDRIGFAVYEIEKIIDDKTAQVESDGGTVTPDQQRRWAVENLDSLAEKHEVSKADVKEALNKDLGLWPQVTAEVPEVEELPRAKNPAKELEAILKDLNDMGREALLRHARELAQIPNYQKKKR